MDTKCGHCGNTDIDVEWDYDTHSAVVVCVDCGAKGPEMPSREEAIEAWRKYDKDNLPAPALAPVNDYKEGWQVLLNWLANGGDTIRRHDIQSIMSTIERLYIDVRR